MPPERLQNPALELMSIEYAIAESPTEGVIAFSYGGDRPGPVALFVTWSPMLEAVSQKLNKLPSLPWMWGRLHLVPLENLKEDRVAEISLKGPNRTFDDVLVLSDFDPDIVDEPDVDANYWAVLRMCADLGMIQGRGVKY